MRRRERNLPDRRWTVPEHPYLRQNPIVYMGMLGGSMSWIEGDAMNSPEIDAAQVVLSYVRSIVANKSVTCDVSQLPFSKKAIKLALKYYIRREKDNQSAESLKCSYIYLADFQNLTEEECEAVQVMERLDSTSALSGGELQALMPKITKAGPVYHELRNRIWEESQQLQAELENLRTQ